MVQCWFLLQEPRLLTAPSILILLRLPLRIRQWRFPGSASVLIRLFASATVAASSAGAEDGLEVEVGAGLGHVEDLKTQTFRWLVALRALPIVNPATNTRVPRVPLRLHHP